MFDPMYLLFVVVPTLVLSLGAEALQTIYPARHPAARTGPGEA